jgi:hypothetical protein
MNVEGSSSTFSQFIRKKLSRNFFTTAKRKVLSGQPSTGEIAWLTEQNEESAAAEKIF